MVLLQDIDFELRSLANRKRTLEQQRLTVNAARARGQTKGSLSPCGGFRASSADCAAWKSVQNLPTLATINERIGAIDIEIENILEQQRELQLQEEIQVTETPQTQPEQNNNLRNALIIGGLIALLAL